jgi:mannose-6-phosphate isomerase-like protein (cupin superfamily)
MGDVQNVTAAMAKIGEPWQPHRLTSINDYDVKVAKFLGEFTWHAHPDTDELFFVVSGEVTIQLRDRDVVPRGVEHCPKAGSEAQVMMFEPKGTVNTGNAPGERTSELREFS